jgi:MoaA/NifB/PqqE/SkfB family radical SAM enzyme
VTRIAVVFPPVEVSRDFIDYPYFADLGAVQATAVLRECGLGLEVEVDIIDALAIAGATVRPAGESRLLLGAPARGDRGGNVGLVDVVGSRDLLVVAFTPFHRPPHRDEALGSLLAALRENNPTAPIVLADLYQSGQHVVDAPSEEVLRAYPEVDIFLRYEAEASLPGLVKRLLADGRPDQPCAEHGEEVADLNTLPLPAWESVDLEAYWALHDELVLQLGRGHWAFPIDRSAMPLLTTRGCPFRCLHCSSNPGLSPGQPKRQRRYAPEYVERYLDQLQALGAGRVQFLDELANVNERHFDALMEAVAVRDLPFEIPNGVRADYVLTRHLEAMHGRLTTLSVSAESGVQRVVDEVVGKDLDLTAITQVAESAQSANVPLLVHFMIGLPGETRAEINQTLEFAVDLFERFGAWPSVQFATPLPGTRLAKVAEATATSTGLALPVVNGSAPAHAAHGTHAAHALHALHALHDWGPHFQQHPSIDTEAFSRDDLRAFKRTFDLRLSAMQGAKKVIMNVTYKCNNRCPFCAVGTRTQVDGNFERQQELLLKYRKQGVELLDYDGGEPTLNPKLFELIRFARRVGYTKVNVTTNGRMAAYEDYARRLVNSGVTTLLFSVHGPNPAIHAANVGVPEAFDQTVEGIKNCRRLAPAGLELGANVTLTRSNYRHLGGIVELVHELGLAWMNIQFLTPFGRATDTVNPNTERAAHETMRVIDEWRGKMKLHVINLPACYMPGYEEFVMGDLLKLERHMLFVNNEEVNLFEYLREQREYEHQCESCGHKVFCGGFYKMDDVPEPEWLIAPEDLLRPVSRDGLTPHPREPRARPGERSGDRPVELASEVTRPDFE